MKRVKIMKKLLIFVLSLMLLGCTPVEKIDVDKDFTLTFFYIETCADCKVFKKKAIPLLEATYGDRITINQYDMDSEGIEAIYDPIIDSLVDFDEEMYGLGPFIVIEGYFAKLGYTEGDEDYLIEDINLALKGEEMGDELGAFRYVYKDEYHY